MEIDIRLEFGASGANLPLYDALHDSAIRHVLARHEQGAGFVAQGMVPEGASLKPA